MKSYIVKGFLLYAVGLGILVFFLVFSASRDFRVVVLDVDQGSGTYIQSDDGFEIVVDGGRHAKFIRSLNRERVWYDRYIDMLVLSHPDADHMGGFPELVKGYDIGVFVHNGETSNSFLYQELMQSLNAKGVKDYITTRGQIVYENQNTRVLVLHPGEKFVAERNDNSIVLRVEHQGFSFLVTGDISKEVERELVQMYKHFIDVDVLVVAHHGSHTSSDSGFVAAASPRYAVISVGKDNRYGHPHQDVLETYNKQHIPVLRTDEQGSITFRVRETLEVSAAK